MSYLASITPETIGLWLGIVVDGLETVFILGAIAAVIVASVQYRRNMFKQQVTTTLNILDTSGDVPCLRLRTLYAGTLADVFPEKATRKAFQRAASATTTNNPFPSAMNSYKEHGRVIGSMTNALSARPGIEQKLAGFLGVENISGCTFVQVPTFERFLDERDHRNRFWVVELNDLKKLLEVDETEVEVEKEDHLDRIRWLQAMAEIFLNGKTQHLSEVDAIRAGFMIHKVKF